MELPEGIADALRILAADLRLVKDALSLITRRCQGGESEVSKALALRMCGVGFALVSAVGVAHLSAPPLAAQSKAAYQLEVSPLTTVSDSLVGYAGYVGQWLRLSSGRVLAGALPGPAIVAQLSTDLRSSRQFMRRGRGPGEADQGFVVFAPVKNGGALVASATPPRVTLLDDNARVRLEAPNIENADGVAHCRDSMLVSGTTWNNSTLRQGVFLLESGRLPRLIYSLQIGSVRRNAAPSSQLMRSRNGRLIVARPNTPQVAISRAACTDLREVRVPLSWFAPWDTVSSKMAWEAPLQPQVTSVYWHNDSIAMLLMHRGRKAAKYETPSASAKRRGEISRPVNTNESWAETVLVAFHASTGRVLAEMVLPRVGWSFLSADELIHHSFISGAERFEVHRVRLRVR